MIDEESFRALLDQDGILRPGALSGPSARGLGVKARWDRSHAYAVFAQRDSAVLDIGALKTQATRFFGAKLGLTVEKRYGLHEPREDLARLVLLADDGASGRDAGTRLCYGRPADANDHAAAARAEEMQRTSGMSLLAERCKMLWLVMTEGAAGTSAPDPDADRVALTIAAILASSLLGPILSPNGDELFGVRTARLKLERRAQPYR